MLINFFNITYIFYHCNFDDIFAIEYSSEIESFSKFADLHRNRPISPISLFTEDSFDNLMSTAEISEEVYENRQESVSQQYYELRSTTETYQGTYNYVFLKIMTI